MGANYGSNSSFKDSVINLAYEIVENSFTLVYGGSSLGMMGLLAKTVKEMDGKVIGIITDHLIEKEDAITILDELIIVNSMQERKKIMQEISDFFIVMPGGLGTIEEAIETWNSIKIGEIQKKIGFLNINGYFNYLFNFANTCKENGFLTFEQERIPEVSSEIKTLISLLKN